MSKEISAEENKPSTIKVPVDVDPEATKPLIEALNEFQKKDPAIGKQALESVIAAHGEAPTEATSKSTKISFEEDKQIMADRGYEYKGPGIGFMKEQIKKPNEVATEIVVPQEVQSGSSVESTKSQETLAQLSVTQHNLLLMEQSAAFYSLHYGKDDPIARDFATARQELEDKMREELFQDWAKQSGYTGSPKKAEYPEADKTNADNEEKLSEAVSQAPYTEEDLQKLLEQSKKPENVDEQEAVRQLEETFQPLIIQTNESGDNIVILNASEATARHKEKPSLPKEAQDILRDAHKQEEDSLKEEQDSESRAPKTPEQNRADELRKEIARLAEIGGASPEAVSSDIVRIQIELEKLEKGRRKKHRGWGWIKERVKGLATVGFWEVHQAERLRSSTKEVAKDVGARTEEIQKTTTLNLADALAEAEKIQFALEAAGKKKDKEKTAEDIERLSTIITKDKMEQNNRVIDETLKQAESELLRRLEKYRNEFGERIVTNDEAIAQAMNNLRVELQQLQDGQRETDVHEIQTVLRNIDPKYWRRYVYGGVEAAVWAAGGYLAWTKLATEKAIATGVKVIQPTLPGDINMHNTIWQSAKELLVNHGVVNPTDQEVLQLSNGFADINGIGVKEWSMFGNPMDTIMKQGYLLKVPKVILKTVLSARGL